MSATTKVEENICPEDSQKRNEIPQGAVVIDICSDEELLEEQQQKEEDEDSDDNERRALLGPENVMTLTSINDCSRFIKDFLQRKGQSSTFNQLFTDIWEVIAHDQKEINGKYDDNLAWSHPPATKGLENSYYSPPSYSTGTPKYFYKTKESVVKKVFEICKRESRAFEEVDKDALMDFSGRLNNVVAANQPGIDFDNVDCDGRKRQKTNFFVPPSCSSAAKKRKRVYDQTSAHTPDHEEQKKSRKNMTMKKILSDHYISLGPPTSCKKCSKVSNQTIFNATYWSDHIVLQCQGVSMDDKCNLAYRSKNNRYDEWLRQHTDYNDETDGENENEVHRQVHSS